MPHRSNKYFFSGVIGFFILCLICIDNYAGSVLKQNYLYEEPINSIELQSYYLKDQDYSAELLSSKPEAFSWKAKDQLDREPWIDYVWQLSQVNLNREQSINLVLRVDRSYTVPTTFYHFANGKLINRISLFEFQHPASINFLYPSFSVALQPGENILLLNYLGARGDPMLELFSQKYFAENSFLNISYVLFVMGMVMLMAVYNVVILFIEKKKEYAWYLLYLTSVFAMTAELSGVTRFLFKTDHIHFGANLVATSPIFLGLFFLSMFNWKKTLPKIVLQLWIIIWISIGYTIFALFASVEQKFTIYALYLPLMPYVSLLGIYALAVECLKGSKQAILLQLGLLTLLSTTFISFLGLWKIIPEIFTYTSLIGFAAELTFFSFALSLRRQEALMSEINAKLHSYGQLEKVFYPHQLQQIQQGNILEQTMPEGEADAAVIAFDVAGSSQIKSSNVKDFLHDVMKACELEMVANYQSDNLVSDAYRVKEMGDGFLCSIGFPFKTIQGKNEAQAAWELSLRFVKAFHTVEKEFSYHEPLYCGIGFAFDKIEAYFPKSGIRQYDLYGRSIVLATRYESYRKMLFEQINERGSVIIVQQKAYDMLDDEAKAQLKEFDLENSKYKIRDDFSAKKLYYKVFQYRV